MSDSVVESRGASSNGALVWEQRLGEPTEHGFDCVGPTAVLMDGKTGQVLLDASTWTSSWIKPQGDGTLVLKLNLNATHALFRLDPARLTFRDKAEGGPERPLAELAEAVEDARQALGRAPVARFISPDDVTMVELAPTEWASSQWVHSPRVTDLRTRRVVLDLWGDDWDATIAFPSEGQVRLVLRRYTHPGQLSFELDLARSTCRVLTETGRLETLPEEPLSHADAAVREASLRADAAAHAIHLRSLSAPAPPRRGWRSALVVIGASLLLIWAALIMLRALRI